MAIALYRKYRPQTFADLTGQDHIRITLTHEVSGNSVAHAYLFTGPRGVGKTSLARIFAKALNCLKRKEGESEPCNSCDACVEQLAGRSLDVVEIDAASNTGVDNVRENIIEHVRFAPTSRRYKVFIIDEVHMLSTSAWNALLKTLEEPPAHAIFIMATTEIHKVPATIISRCQRFDFKRIPFESMVERLKRMAEGEGVEVDQVVLEAVAKLGDGCLRDAESLLEQVFSLDEKRIGINEASLVLPRSNSELVISFVDALAARKGAVAIELINKLTEEGVDLGQFINETIEYLRALLILSLGAPSKIIPTEATKQLGVSQFTRLLNLLMVARLELKSSAIAQLPLELVTAEYCGDLGVVTQTVSSNNQDGNKSSSQKVETVKPAPVVKEVVVPVQEKKQVEPVTEIQIPKSVIKEDTTPVISNTPSVNNVSSEIVIPLDTLSLRWDELCASVQEENPTLPFLLRVSRPLRFEEGFLVIGVQYKLHADKLNQAKNRDSVARGLTTLYNGVNIPVRAEIAAAVSDLPASNPLGNDLLQQFGGSVVG